MNSAVGLYGTRSRGLSICTSHSSRGEIAALGANVDLFMVLSDQSVLIGVSSSTEVASISFRGLRASGELSTDMKPKLFELTFINRVLKANDGVTCILCNLFASDGPGLNISTPFPKTRVGSPAKVPALYASLKQMRNQFNLTKRWIRGIGGK